MFRRFTCQSDNVAEVEEKEIPSKCKCDISSWGCIANIKDICDNFQDDGDNVCINCEHDKACHFDGEKVIRKIGGC